MKTIVELPNGASITIEWDPTDDAMSARVRDVIRRLSDETPAAIRDRCYSLVQSMAEWDGDKSEQPGDTWENEAWRIARDAGWSK